MERQFRSAKYRIEVVNPERVSRGKVTVLADGEVWTGITLPYQDGGEYQISVRLEPGE